MPKQKVLFICVHNSARSQMGAALLNKTCGEFFEAQSAGLEPGTINPLVIDVFRRSGSIFQRTERNASSIFGNQVRCFSL